MENNETELTLELGFALISLVAKSNESGLLKKFENLRKNKIFHLFGSLIIFF